MLVLAVQFRGDPAIAMALERSFGLVSN